MGIPQNKFILVLTYVIIGPKKNKQTKKPPQLVMFCPTESYSFTPYSYEAQLQTPQH